MPKQHQQLTSLPFITSLFLLLINDFILKDYLHNFLTGKLSDFCGLFVFVIFWSVCFPKAKGPVFFATAFLFVLWKSPYSQGFINLFSDLIFPIDRVVDLSDLTALLISPFAWWQLNKTRQVSFTHPLIASTLALFSFCATSISPPRQAFDLPQYILLETSRFRSDTALKDDDIDDFRFHSFGNLIAVEVKSIQIEAYPAKEDDYQKVQTLKDLDGLLIEKMDKYGYLSLTKASGGHNLVVKTADRIDSLNFNGSRLNGKFTRTDTTGQILIKGQYKNGIEEGTWIFSNTTPATVIKTNYKNGEALSSETYSNNKLISSEQLNTRADTVRNKCFQLIILLVLVVGMIILIVRNYKTAYPNVINYKIIEKVLYPFVLPFTVWLAIELCLACLPDTASAVFKLFTDGVLSFLFTAPLFFIVFFGIKIRKRIDVLWYVLLFALVFVLVQESNQLYRLWSDVGGLGI